MNGPPHEESRPKAAPESMRGGYDISSVTQPDVLDRLDTVSYAYSCGWEAGRRSGYIEGRKAEQAEAERAEALLWQQAVRIVHNMAGTPDAPAESPSRAAERERLLRGPVREGRRSA
ncbi:hypothetical protein [Phycicoccus avicenniae]|uniref:hypothetical protein n=1 Tax=Phycicoccus avicenniae TaxID=2828860 RepID=UPI003D2B9FAA